MGNNFRTTEIEQKKQYLKYFLNDSLLNYSILETDIDSNSFQVANSGQLRLKSFKMKPIDSKLMELYIQDHKNQHYTIIQQEQYIYSELNADKNQRASVYRRYFLNKEEMNKFLGNVFFIKDIKNLKLYSQINEGYNQEQCYVQTIINYEGNKIERRNMDVNSKLNVLYICSVILKTIENIHINPKNIIVDDGNYQIVNIQVKQKQVEDHNLENIAIWLFNYNHQYEQLQNEQITIKIQNYISKLQTPTMLKQILLKKFKKSINSATLSDLLQGMIIRGSNILYKMDSFHACLYYRFSELINSQKEWIQYKHKNEIYFFNLSDHHFHKCQLIRKRKKINVDNTSIVYDEDQCEIIFHKKGTSHLITANQFELEMQESISDITLYEKLPIHLTNPKLYKFEKQIYILEKNLYKLTLQKPKLLKQLCKSITKHIEIIPNTKKKEIYIILESKDIFKEGIHVWTKQQEIKLRLAGNEYMINELSQIQMDIIEIDFCIEIYFNIYIVLACRNLFIFDMNYKCFFSYSSLTQIQRYEQNRLVNPNAFNYMFEIKNQNFIVQFPPNQASNNACFKNNKLNILGIKGNEVVYLVYQFQPTTGSLILQYYKSAMYQSDLFKRQVKLLPQSKLNLKQHKFMVDSQQIFIYKYEQWYYESEKLLKIVNFNLMQQKNNYTFIVQSQPVIQSLKDEFNELNKREIWYTKKQITHLLYKIFQLFLEIYNLEMIHRNFNAKNIYFTSKKSLKLTSWTEPGRIQYITDFRDFLLLYFNIITNNQYEKLNIQILENNSKKFEGFQQIYKIIHKNVKQSLNQEKKAEVDACLNNIKIFLENQLTKKINSISSNQYVFNILDQKNIFYIMNIYEQKLLKYEIFEEDESPFIFCSKYNYLWNEELGVLYILTQTKFKTIKLDIINNKEKLNIKVKIEDQQFMPRKVRKPSMCLLPSKNWIYFFGGLEYTSDGKIIVSKIVTMFDIIKLQWEQKNYLCYTLVGSTPVASQDGRFIYLFGGTSSQINLQSNQLKLIIYDVQNDTNYLKIDCNKSSPYLNCFGPAPIVFKYSTQDPLFVFYSINQKRHNVSIVQLLNEGLKLNFCIEQQQNDPEDEKVQERKQQCYSRISYSSKDKNIYYLSNNNKLFILVFNNIAEPFLEVVMSH